MKKKTRIFVALVLLLGAAAAFVVAAKRDSPSTVDPIRGRSSTALIEADLAQIKPQAS